MKKFNETDDPRRALLLQALAAGLLGGAWFDSPLAADLLGGRPAKLPPGQSIYRVSGKVLVNGQAAAADTPIAATDIVETAPGSEIIFVVGANAMLVRGDSRVALKATGPAAALAAIEVLKGKVLTVFGSGEPRRIVTSTATIRIRGTGVYLEADPQQTYFCTCYGEADVAANKDPTSTETVVATHHDKPLYILAVAQPGRGIRAAPFVNHNDQELLLIETLVGRTPPFIFPGSQYNTPRSNARYK